MRHREILHAERIVLDAHVVYAPNVIAETKQALADQLIGTAHRLGYRYHGEPEVLERRELVFGSAALEVTHITASLEVEVRS